MLDSLTAALLPAACLTLLAACGEMSPPLAIGAAPVDGEVRRDAPGEAGEFFDSACASCHEEGAASCLTAGYFADGRLGKKYDAVPAHAGVPIPERMRRALLPLVPAGEDRAATPR